MLYVVCSQNSLCTNFVFDMDFNFINNHFAGDSSLFFNSTI